MSVQVDVRHLSKRYGHTEALNEVSLQIDSGEIFGLLGPNGAGKTTLLECLSGLRQPDSGEITLGGADALRQPERSKSQIGVLLQQNALQAAITPREALTLFGAFYPERVAPLALLQRFALIDKADAPFETLSAGQRQRLALALAFVNRPRLVLLDEPTSTLDPHARLALHAEIRRLKQDGVTVLLSTHDLDEAEKLCDRIAVIDHGRIIGSGTPSELIGQATLEETFLNLTSRP